MISGFHFYELKDPPGKHNTVILVVVVTENGCSVQFRSTYKSIKNDLYTPVYLCYLYTRPSVFISFDLFHSLYFRSSHSHVVYKKVVLKNCTKCTSKQTCRSLLLKKSPSTNSSNNLQLKK